jgi:hypothetical protein
MLAVVTLALAMGCGDPASGADARADGATPDAGVDARPQAPWVETFVGKDCSKAATTGLTPVPRRDLVIGFTDDVAVGNDGSVYVRGQGVWRIVGDEARIVVPYGSWGDGVVGQPGVGMTGGSSIAAHRDGSLYLADSFRLRKVRDGTITTVAGPLVHELGYVDGPAKEARFGGISDIVVVGDAVLLADGQYVRRFDGSVVSTIAGRGTFDPKAGAVAGPALETGLLVGGLCVRGEAVWLYSYFHLWRLQNGWLTPEAGSFPRPLTPFPYRDGPAADALFGGLGGFVGVGERLLIADLKHHALRELTAGVVSTLNDDTGAMPPKAGYRDGPLRQARFDQPSGIATDGKGRVYVADSGNCRIRRIHLE